MSLPRRHPSIGSLSITVLATLTILAAIGLRYAHAQSGGQVAKGRIAFDGAGKATHSVTSPITGDLPDRIATGNLLIAYLAIVPTSGDVSAPPGWHLIGIAGPASGSTRIEQMVYYYIMGPRPSTTWSWPGGEAYATLQIAAYSGQDSDNPIRQFGATSSGDEALLANGSLRSPTLYAQKGNQLLISFATNWNTASDISLSIGGNPALTNRWFVGNLGYAGQYLGDTVAYSSGATSPFVATFGAAGGISAVSAAVEIKGTGPYEPIPTLTATATPTIVPGPSPWPMFHRDVTRAGQSEIKTSIGASAIKWSYSVGDPIGSSPGIGSDGTIYLGAGIRLVEPQPHSLYAINPDGTLKWRFKTEGDVFSSPAISPDGQVYVGSADNSLYAINPDGTQSWKFETRGPVDSSPAIGAGGIVYFGSDDSFLYALSPNGKEKWGFEAGAELISSPTIASDGTIYAGAEDGYLYAVTSDGKLKWKLATGGMFMAPALGADGTIYAGSDDHNLYAISPDGKVKWKFVTGAAVRTTPAIGRDGTIYEGSTDNSLYAINPDGTQKWRLGIAGVFCSPALDAEGIIFVGSEDGDLYTINSAGKIIGKTALGGGIQTSSPAIGSDGTVYVGSLNGKLYAIQTGPR
ncbi:MAG TPA: PQQ-binding-like beta-propeller repeat protein [Candidatus Binataceae bacterium]|nr:PQQ-binding-like beta-propeller repeat protein [Candidatus Binataceae bacterium]